MCVERGWLQLICHVPTTCTTVRLYAPVCFCFPPQSVFAIAEHCFNTARPVHSPRAGTKADGKLPERKRGRNAERQQDVCLSLLVQKSDRYGDIHREADKIKCYLLACTIMGKKKSLNVIYQTRF